MKHLNNPASIVLLSFCLYFAIHHTDPHAAKTDRVINHPPGIHNSLTEDLVRKSDGNNSELNGDQQVLLNETFEGPWPSSGWAVVDLSDDGKDRKWGNDEYRPHAPGIKAAWPARAGSSGRDPTTKNNDYFNSMDSRMVYGPIDLSDACTLEISFWMWWQTETNLDFLILEVSRDNLSFDEIGRWSGTSGGWQNLDISTVDYALDSSVWVSWRFMSNGSNVLDGPWVDDIIISITPPQFVDVQGILSYYDRYNNPVGAAYTTVELYDHDVGGDGDDLLSTTNTGPDGSFNFIHIYNIDDDDDDPIDQLDLYVVWKTIYRDSELSQHQVENLNGQIYQWQSNIINNVSVPTIYFNKEILSGDPELGAIWLFEDLYKAWSYFFYNTSPSYEPGNVTIKWEYDKFCYFLDQWICNSFFYAYPFDTFVFIRGEFSLSSDIVIHEIGHAFMYNISGWWWWSPFCWDHQMFSSIDASCAWSEGWADFYPLVVNGDSCFDFDIGPCTGIPDDRYFNLELHNLQDPWWLFPFGETIEGRVAGSLYDLYDFNWPIENFDDAYFTFNDIASIIINIEPVENSFYEFWNSWGESGYNKHHAIRAFYQNTVDYNTYPYFNQPLPLLYGLKNSPIHHAIDLWPYSADIESLTEELSYSIADNFGCDFNVTDDHWIDVSPWQDWLGECWSIIQVTDSIYSDNGILSININDIIGIAYLPIVSK